MLKIEIFANILFFTIQFFLFFEKIISLKFPYLFLELFSAHPALQLRYQERMKFATFCTHSNTLNTARGSRHTLHFQATSRVVPREVILGSSARTPSLRLPFLHHQRQTPSNLPEKQIRFPDYSAVP